MSRAVEMTDRLRHVHAHMRRHLSRYGPIIATLHPALVGELGHAEFCDPEGRVEPADVTDAQVAYLEMQGRRVQDAWGQTAREQHFDGDFDRIVGALGRVYADAGERMHNVWG